MSKRTIVLASRGSKLALTQTEQVKALFEQAAPEFSYRIQVVHTKGDKITDVALSKFGDKGLFTKELERELLAGNVDACVHSMKDMPTMLPEGLAIKGVPKRVVPVDVVVAVQKGTTIDSLKPHARVATGSLRRVAQLRRLRPDIEVCEMRGNVDTRCRRVRDGEFDAAILAAAGIKRLGLDDNIASEIPADTMIPAVGQGAIAVEVRDDDPTMARLCEAITDAASMRAVTAERIVLRALEGGCQVPMGVHAHEVDGRFVMDAFVSSLDGARFVRSAQQGTPEASEDVAWRVVDELKAGGAEAILEELR